MRNDLAGHVYSYKVYESDITDMLISESKSNEEMWNTGWLGKLS